METLKKIKLKIQLFLILFGSILIAYIYFRAKNTKSIRKQLEYDLTRVEKEKELVALEKDEKEKKKKLKSLKKQEESIRNNIKYIEKKEVDEEELSPEELQKFFEERGF